MNENRSCKPDPDSCPTRFNDKDLLSMLLDASQFNLIEPKTEKEETTPQGYRTDTVSEARAASSVDLESTHGGCPIEVKEKVYLLKSELKETRACKLAGLETFSNDKSPLSYDAYGHHYAGDPPLNPKPRKKTVRVSRRETSPTPESFASTSQQRLFPPDRAYRTKQPKKITRYWNTPSETSSQSRPFRSSHPPQLRSSSSEKLCDTQFSHDTEDSDASSFCTVAAFGTSCSDSDASISRSERRRPKGRQGLAPQRYFSDGDTSSEKSYSQPNTRRAPTFLLNNNLDTCIPQRSADLLLKEDQAELGTRSASSRRNAPSIAFSVTYKSPRNAHFMVYVCGDVPELGGSVFPQRVMRRGIPLSKDPDGCGYKDYWKSDPVDFFSRTPGSTVYYTYYVLQFNDPTGFAVPDSTIQPTLYAQEISVFLSSKSTMPQGVRSFILPKPRISPDATPRQALKQRYFYLIDFRFKNLSKKSRLALAAVLDEDDDQSDESLDI